MALQRPLWIMPYASVAAALSPIKIVQGGASAPYPTNQTLTNSYGMYFANHAFVCRGRPYLQTSVGLITFNYATNTWELIGPNQTAKMTCVGSRCVVYAASSAQCLDTPESLGTADSRTTTPAAVPYDHVVHNGDIYYSPVAAATYHNQIWGYPFTGALANAGIVLLNRLAVHRGAVYGILLSTGTSYLYKCVSGSYVVQGGGFSLTDAANISTPATYKASTAAFFSWNGKLWLIVGYNGAGAGTWLYRCYAIALSGDAATENTNVIPAAFQVAPGAGVHRRIWEALDDAGSTRQVFIGVWSASPGTLDVYEFDSESTAMSLVANVGTPINGTPIFWDPTIKSCEVWSGSDSVPSSYASITHAVSSLSDNGTVDVDIRYKDTVDTAHDPPWYACTNKTGQGEGKTALSSKPAGITLATHLSDDFEDGVLDSNKWLIAHDYVSWAAATNHGMSYFGWQAVSEEGGMLRLGGTSPAPTFSSYPSIGVRTKWAIGGDFSVDAVVELTNLRTGTAGAYSLMFAGRVGYSQIYGIRIWINSTGSVNSCEGFTISPNAIPSISATSTGFANGITFRISRTSGTWGLILDPAGANTSLLPASTPTYNSDVHFALSLMRTGASNPALGTPGPGWRGFIVNSGTLGNFHDVVSHIFAWDHVTDVGADVSKSYALFGDTN